MTLEIAPAATPAEGTVAPVVPPTIPADAVPPPDTTPETPDAKAGEPPAPVDAKLAPRFAALAKKERETVAKIAEWKPKFEAAEKFEAARAKVAEDPFAALDILGIDLQKLVDSAIGHGKSETVEGRLERLERERKEERAKATADADALSAQQQQAVFDNYKSSVASAIDADPDTNELIIARKAHGVVYDVIVEHWNKTGQLMPTADAAKLVEDHFFEEAKASLGLKKLAALTAAPAAKDGKPVAPSFSASTTKPNPAPIQPPPAYETHDQAIERISRTLKKPKAG